MSKSQGIIVIIAIIAVIFLFNLPKFIVKDDRKGQSKEAMNASVPKNEQAHSSELSETDLKEIVSLRKNYYSVSEKEKKIKFADSLAGLFKNLNKFDSSAKYLGEIANLDPKPENIIRAGDAYFEASTFSINKEKATQLALDARGYFEKAQGQKPGDLELKTRVAKTIIAEDPTNPQYTMKAVGMLKEVVSKDPLNQNALLALGMLSIQSGQFNKAIERFQALLNGNPNNVEGLFYLGYSQMMAGEKANAKSSFEKVKRLTKDPNILKSTEEYLKELNK
jgi:tetratricopeptide (TPR) repeat protein